MSARADVVRRPAWRRTTALMLCGVLLVAGCQAERVIHGDGEGPLSAQNGGGGNSIYLPDDVTYPWYATFASYMLCRMEGESPIELQAVMWDVADWAPPFEVTPWLRYVDDTTEPTGPGSSFIGVPWKTGKFGGKPMAGRLSKRIAGVVITKRCADLDAERTGNFQPEFTGLLFVVKTGREGGHITRAYVDYLADGKPYRLVINWDMVTCGYVVAQHSSREDVEEPDKWCDRDPNLRPKRG